MDQELRNVWGEAAVDALAEDIGVIGRVDLCAPGTYYVSARKREKTGSRREYYVAERDSTVLSPQAKEYGIPVAAWPALLLFQVGKEQSGYKIVDFELARYLEKNGGLSEPMLPPRCIALFAMGEHPEYFGLYPAPVMTPFGDMLRYRTLENGVFWIETDRNKYTLALCYPIWSSDISDTAQKLGELTEYDRKNDVEKTYGYLFFSEENSCIPIFELLNIFPGLKTVNLPALMNAIWTYHPEYAVFGNFLEQQEGNDPLHTMLSGLCPQEVLMDPAVCLENIIAYFPEAGTKFVQF